MSGMGGFRPTVRIPARGRGQNAAHGPDIGGTGHVPAMSPDAFEQSGTEHGSQAAFFAWANRAARVGIELADDMSRYSQLDPALAEAVRTNTFVMPYLRWMHAIPNGGERSKATAGTMKAEGVKSGVLDIFLPYPINPWHGLYIEMKRKTGSLSDLSDNQRAFIRDLNDFYCMGVAFGWRDARGILLEYLTFGRVSVHAKIKGQLSRK